MPEFCSFLVFRPGEIDLISFYFRCRELVHTGHP